MFTLKEILLAQQPKTYEQIMAIRSKMDKKKRPREVGDREIENLMRHDSYRRIRGGLRQVRRA